MYWMSAVHMSQDSEVGEQSSCNDASAHKDLAKLSF